MQFNVKSGARSRILPILLSLAFACPASAADLMTSDAVDHLAARAFWETSVPLASGDHVVKTVLLDDNLYVLTSRNIAFAIHAATGVIRWTAQVAEPGHSLRGPTHAGMYVLFTGPASVKAYDSATGEPAGEPRELRGVIFEMSHDVATISIGRAHGVRPDDVLSIYRTREDVGDLSRVLGQFKTTEISERQAKGIVSRSSLTKDIGTGMIVAADVKLPLLSIKLPFAASSPAVGDGYNMIVGGADQRLYSLDLITGFPNWQTTVPKTTSVAPLLIGDKLYYAGRDGMVSAAVLGTGRRDEARSLWKFETEGAIFADMAADAQRLYVASSDRLLYCLDRATGKRLWFKRFDQKPDAEPRLAEGRIYQTIADDGLFVLDAATGQELWRHPEGGKFLVQIGRDAYIYESGPGHRVLRLDAATGKVRSCVDAPLTAFAEASQKGQLIILTGEGGRAICLRPKSAPTLKPAELAAVLQNDARARALARMSEAERARLAARNAKSDEKSSRPDIGFLDEDDLLASRSSAKPVGTSSNAAERSSAEPKSDASEDSEKEAADDEDSGNDDEKASDDADDESGDEDEDKADDDDGDSDDEGKADDDDSDDDDDDEEAGDDEDGDDKDDSDDDSEDEDDDDDEDGR